MRVLAAMSGGVDSAVAAARAVDAGHDVTACTWRCRATRSPYRSGARGCCTLEDARDARRAADVLGIPFYVWDLAERFAHGRRRRLRRRVRGRAHAEPVPALQRADQVRRGARPGRGARLRRGVHRPLRAPGRRTGRPRAAPRGRPGQGPVVRAGVLTARPAGRRDVPARRLDQGAGAGRGGAARARRRGQAGQPRHLLRRRRRHRRVPARRLGDAPGSVVDADGAVLGEHDGAYAFTVGQRTGLAAGPAGADGRPRYVLDDRAGHPHGDGRIRASSWRSRWLEGERHALVRVAGRRAVRVRRPAARARRGAAARVAEPGPDAGRGWRSPRPAVRRRARPGRWSSYDGTRVVGSATVGPDLVRVSAPTRRLRCWPVRAPRPASGRCRGPTCAASAGLALGRGAGPAVRARAAGPRPGRRHDRAHAGAAAGHGRASGARPAGRSRTARAATCAGRSRTSTRTSTRVEELLAGLDGPLKAAGRAGRGRWPRRSSCAAAGAALADPGAVRDLASGARRGGRGARRRRRAPACPGRTRAPAARRAVAARGAAAATLPSPSGLTDASRPSTEPSWSRLLRAVAAAVTAAGAVTGACTAAWRRRRSACCVRSGAARSPGRDPADPTPRTTTHRRSGRGRRRTPARAGADQRRRCPHGPDAGRDGGRRPLARVEPHRAARRTVSLASRSHRPAGWRAGRPTPPGRRWSWPGPRPARW